MKPLTEIEKAELLDAIPIEPFRTSVRRLCFEIDQLKEENRKLQDQIVSMDDELSFPRGE